MWTSTTVIAALCIVGAKAGSVTTYAEIEVSQGNCDFIEWPDFADINYAAVADEYYEGGNACGRCVEITCTDESCADQTTSHVMYVVDSCPSCAADIDLGPTAFETVTGATTGIIDIEWDFVDCPVTGNARYCSNDVSDTYVSIQPTNLVTGITSLMVEGVEGTRAGTTHVFEVHDVGTTSSVAVTMTSAEGEVIEDTVSLVAYECVDGNVQFGASTTQTDTTEDELEDGSDGSLAPEVTTSDSSSAWSEEAETTISEPAVVDDTASTDGSASSTTSEPSSTSPTPAVTEEVDMAASDSDADESTRAGTERCKSM